MIQNLFISFPVIKSFALPEVKMIEEKYLEINIKYYQATTTKIPSLPSKHRYSHHHIKPISEILQPASGSIVSGNRFHLPVLLAGLT